MPTSPTPFPPDQQPSARVSVDASGALKLNGAPSSLDAIAAELQRLQAVNGSVYYYRETPYPHHRTPAAERVFALILDLHLTVTLISTPDFSEYFDNEGQSWPRDQNKRREVFRSAVMPLVLIA